jgi:hypothetical protein
MPPWTESICATAKTRAAGPKEIAGAAGMMGAVAGVMGADGVGKMGAVSPTDPVDSPGRVNKVTCET